MLKSVLYAMTWVMVVMLPQGARAGETITIERSKVLAIEGDILKDHPVTLTAGKGPGTVATYDVLRPGAKSMRLRFQLASAPADRSWKIKVIDAAGRLAWSYSPQETDQQEIEWSGDVRGESARVEVESEGPNNPFQVTIDRIAVSQLRTTAKSITEPDQREKIAQQPVAVKNLGKAVARLRFAGDDDVPYVCTGFLVAADLFMTNHHCPQSEKEWRSALIDFDYDSDSAKPLEKRFRELVLADRDLDFALFRLAAPLSDRQPLALDVKALGENAELLVIEHPGGEPKQVSRIDCRINGAGVEGVSSQKTDFGHECDTLGGSSGSPVLDRASNRVIGLHHLGFTASSAKLVNRAVQVREIIDLIRAKQPKLLEELALPAPPSSERQ